MKKEELFNIIGEVDEQKVTAAGMAMNTKKTSRPVWMKWGAMVACLCLVVVGALVVPTLINNTPVGDMVCINGELYRDVSTQISYTELNEETAYLGKIESEISNSYGVSDGIPKENFQANHSIVGSEVYRYGDDILIEINGKSWLYEQFSEGAN